MHPPRRTLVDRLAPHWIVVLKYDGINSEQSLITASELLHLHSQHRLQVQTLVVGVTAGRDTAERKTITPVSAAFFRQANVGVVFSDLTQNQHSSLSNTPSCTGKCRHIRPLQFVLVLVATGNGYDPVSEQMLLSGQPPNDW